MYMCVDEMVWEKKAVLWFDCKMHFVGSYVWIHSSQLVALFWEIVEPFGMRRSSSKWIHGGQASWLVVSPPFLSQMWARSFTLLPKHLSFLDELHLYTMSRNKHWPFSFFLLVIWSQEWEKKIWNCTCRMELCTWQVGGGDSYLEGPACSKALGLKTNRAGMM